MSGVQQGTAGVPTPIANLPVAASVTGADQIMVVQSGVTRLATMSDIFTQLSGIDAIVVNANNGVTASVVTVSPTSTITLGLGNITPNSVAAAGTVTGSNLSGNNTGDQTITLTGDVTGSGTGSFAATISNSAVTYAKIQNVSAASVLLGRGAGGGAGVVQEIGLGTGLTMSGTTISGPAWNSVNAATADGSTSNTTFQITYQTAPTADSKVAWRFTESAAATGGTSTSGVPNQVLLKLDTLAASTQSPLSVYSRASHVFSVSPSTTQIFAASGAAATPTYSFAAATNTGMYYTGTVISFPVGGANVFQIFSDHVSLRVSAAANPGLTGSSPNDGIWFASSVMGISIGAVENSRFTIEQFIMSKGSADALSYLLDFRKSRGTVAAPTVITSGDTLGDLRWFGYLGATNTYRQAAGIQVDSTGTIGDSTTGIGSIVRIQGTTQGTDSAVQDTVIINGGSTATLQLKGSGMFAANGTVATAMSNLGPTGSHTTIQEWLVVKNAAGTTRWIPMF